MNFAVMLAVYCGLSAVIEAFLSAAGTRRPKGSLSAALFAVAAGLFAGLAAA